ncbi:MAG: SUMF1/EgtB/PvdO family nonheme iron enzyme [Bacteroidia bacterium]|nr:SUMF1/EgtB/PvdO family nonheme iron enzyme [Bacteroidia bacterium]
MSTNNKHKVSEKELDNLLGQAFLNLDFNNPKNQELMETISNQVLAVKAVTTSIINKALFTKLAVAIVIITTSAFIYFNYFKNNNNYNPIQNANTTAAVSNPEQIQKTEEHTTASENLNDKTKSKTEQVTTDYEPIQKQEPVSNEWPKQPLPLTIYSDNETKLRPKDTNYVFPKLTEKEIKETKRQKDKMTTLLLKQSKDRYALIIPKAAHSVMSNIEDSTAQFFMQNTEVSNLEFKTFLFDLLINGDKEAFLKAKPHQELWLNAPGHGKKMEMKENYFSDKRYNDYPVVNITPEGAQLYCKWLTTISNAKIVARLPFENEWMKAAKGKNQEAIYPWPGDSIQNKNGCHLANFCIQKQSEKLRANIKCVPKNKNAYSSAELMLGDSMMTCKVFSYNPNDYGVYCMAGNVAEMVYDNKTDTVISKGGSWNSDLEQCKIGRKEELNGSVKANSMTGFRPVFRITQTHLFGSVPRENPETGLPTLTTEEISSSEKQKKKMIDALVKLNKEKYSYIPMGSCSYKNEMVSVQAFYMRKTEITNLEYRAFMMDLLANSRKEEYLIVKPDQNMWKNKFPYSFNDPLVNLYFSHPAYDEYPVVNISRKAAQLYCDWLTIETNKVLKETDKLLMNDLRIPDEYEWALAASNGKDSAKYANGQESLKDNKGKYDVNYMCFSKEQCSFDSVLNLYVPKKVVSKDRILQAAFTDDGAFHANQTHSYNPNIYGIYGMAGNVSEMIINHKTNQPETKGGSWFSCDYFLEINADDEYKGEIKASPLIGFRPVFTAQKK